MNRENIKIALELGNITHEQARELLNAIWREEWERINDPTIRTIRRGI